MLQNNYFKYLLTKKALLNKQKYIFQAKEREGKKQPKKTAHKPSSFNTAKEIIFCCHL